MRLITVAALSTLGFWPLLSAAQSSGPMAACFERAVSRCDARHEAGPQSGRCVSAAVNQCVKASSSKPPAGASGQASSLAIGAGQASANPDALAPPPPSTRAKMDLVCGDVIYTVDTRSSDGNCESWDSGGKKAVTCGDGTNGASATCDGCYESWGKGSCSAKKRRSNMKAAEGKAPVCRESEALKQSLCEYRDAGSGLNAFMQLRVVIGEPVAVAGSAPLVVSVRNIVLLDALHADVTM